MLAEAALVARPLRPEERRAEQEPLRAVLPQAAEVLPAEPALVGPVEQPAGEA